MKHLFLESIYFCILRKVWLFIKIFSLLQYIVFSYMDLWGFSGKESSCNAGDPGLIPESGRSPREVNGNPLQYSCWENSMDRGPLLDYSPWCHKESDTTGWLHIHILCFLHIERCGSRDFPLWGNRKFLFREQHLLSSLSWIMSPYQSLC